MGFQLSVERWISSGQYWPGLCQAGHTIGLEGLLGVKGGDGRGEGVRSVERGKYSGVFLVVRFFFVFIPFWVSYDTMLVFVRE